MTRLFSVAMALSMAASSAALAQGIPPAEIMLIVDTSTSMDHSMTAPGRRQLQHCTTDFRSRDREFRGETEEIVNWLPEPPAYEADWTRLQAVKQALAGRPIRHVDEFIDDRNKTACFETRQPLIPAVAEQVYSQLIGLGTGISAEADIFGRGGLRLTDISQRAMLPLMGNQGGEQFTDQCPLGELLIGVRGELRPGDAAEFGPLCAIGNRPTPCVKAIRAVCGRPVLRNNIVQVEESSVLPMRQQAAGLEQFSAMCPEGRVVTGFKGRAGVIVDNLRLSCSELRVVGNQLVPGRPRPLVPVGGNGGDEFDLSLCPNGNVGTGMLSWAGPSVSGFSIQCGRISVELDIGPQADTSYVRMKQSQCYDFNPARPDECSPLRLINDDTPSDRFHSDGIIHRYANKIKFGLMSTDDSPDIDFRFPAYRTRGSSFGVDQTDLEVNAGEFARVGVLADKLSGSVNARQRPNLGVRAPGAGNPGDLVGGHVGLIEQGRRSVFRAIGDDEGQVSAHNEFVMQSLRSLSPFGFSPLSAMLYDLRYYYRTQDPSARAVPERFGLLPDVNYYCRPKAAILITDGRQSNYYASRECLDSGQGCPPHEGYPYQPLRDYVVELERDVPSFKLHVVLLHGDDEDVRTLRAAVGNAEGSFFQVQNHEELRAALDNIAKQYLPEDQVKTRPLVFTPGEGDDALDDRIRQIRVTTSAEQVQGVTYGRLLAEAVGCRGGGQDDPNGRLQYLRNRTQRFHNSLARQPGRTTVSTNTKANDDTFQVLGNGPAVFSADGDFQASADMTEASFRQLTSAPSPGGAAADPLNLVYQALAGLIGPAREPLEDGSCSPVCGPVEGQVKQLGEMRDGDLIAVPPPLLGIRGESYLAFRAENRDRPTLVVSGAQDGQVHFFRATDGREVLTFVPHLAWESLQSAVNQPGAGTVAVDGPLMARDVAVCRSLGEGSEGCPADADETEFRTLLVGGVGQSGANIFAVDLTNAKPLLMRESQDQALNDETVTTWDMVTGGDGLGDR